MPASPRFVSTRGKGPPVSFEEALLNGLAPDGGLYVPEQIPPLALADPAGHDAFPPLAADVLAGWLPSVPAPVLERMARDAFNFAVPLVPLSGELLQEVYVLELFHGPTLSFKDFGARAMARLMAHFMQQRQRHLTILVATSGDTGSAVASGFAGHENISVVLLYPEGQVSPVQERQLIARRPGVRSYAVEGTFDDCQRLVKEAFTDEALHDVLLSSANSINVGRLLPQMLYYVWAAHQQAQQPDEPGEVVFCVPSGNLGNLTGGVLAALSGLPVRRFIAAHNANDFFPRHLEGRADRPDGPSTRTLSNAMDVGAPSNFERLRWLLDEEERRRRLWGTSVSDESTLQAMRQTHAQTDYVADPHTAVGLEAVQHYRQQTGDTTPAVVLATAHPAKFPGTVEKALGTAPAAPERLARLWDEPTRVEALPATLGALREQLLEHAAS